MKSFLGNFYRHLAIFFGHTAYDQQIILTFQAFVEVTYEIVGNKIF